MMKYISGRKKNTDFISFLRGRPASDYVFQDVPYEKQVKEAAVKLDMADAVIIGAGAGLSAAAGLTYGGKRFTDNFGEFIEKYGSEYMTDMYNAGFYPFPTEEAKWGYWSNHVWLNRIEPDGLPLYQSVYELVKEKPHFVLTTNVDQQFWKAGFSDDNIFATQGDYGKIQCKRGCHSQTYDAINMFTQMHQARKDCLIPSYMIPKCPVCGGDMAMHLRCDQYFVEDEHWNQAAVSYVSFLKEHEKEKVVLLELGVGFNTPGIIKYPFWQMTVQNPKWVYVCMNDGEAVCPQEMKQQFICLNGDIGTILEKYFFD